jgi:N utilization substance protein B
MTEWAVPTMSDKPVSGQPTTAGRNDGKARSARRLSRLLAVQSTYQWLLSAEEPGAIEAFARESEDYAAADRAYFEDCFYGVVRQSAELREKMSPALDRDLHLVSPVEHAILLLGCYEFLHHIEVPYRVVINEAVELAKSLGGNEGHKYINGVLDRLAPLCRPDELRA